MKKFRLTVTPDIIAQAMIFILGTLSIYLIGIANKWGFALGLASQPFWYYTTIKHRQWGILAASVVYTISWSIGFYHWFFDCH